MSDKENTINIDEPVLSSVSRSRFAKVTKIKDNIANKYKLANKGSLFIGLVLTAAISIGMFVIRTPFVYSTTNTESFNHGIVSQAQTVTMDTIILRVKDEDYDVSNPSNNSLSVNQIPGVQNSTTSSNVSADAQAVIQYFENAGYNHNAAIGIAANFAVETGGSFSYLSDNGSHKGIAQWDSGRWAGYQSFLARKGLVDSLDSQLAYAVAEMNGTDGVKPRDANHVGVAALNTCTSKYHATKVVARWYEGCVKGGGLMGWDNDDAPQDAKFNATCQGAEERLKYADSF